MSKRYITILLWMFVNLISEFVPMIKTFVVYIDDITKLLFDKFQFDKEHNVIEVDSNERLEDVLLVNNEITTVVITNHLFLSADIKEFAKITSSYRNCTYCVLYLFSESDLPDYSYFTQILSCGIEQIIFGLSSKSEFLLNCKLANIKHHLLTPISSVTSPKKRRNSLLKTLENDGEYGSSVSTPINASSTTVNMSPVSSTRKVSKDKILIESSDAVETLISKKLYAEIDHHLVFVNTANTRLKSLISPKKDNSFLFSKNETSSTYLKFPAPMNESPPTSSEHSPTNSTLLMPNNKINRLPSFNRKDLHLSSSSRVSIGGKESDPEDTFDANAENREKHAVMRRLQGELDKYKKLLADLVWNVIRDLKFKGIPECTNLEPNDDEDSSLPFILGIKLGKGAFGIVYKAKDRHTDDIFAVKRLRKDKVYNFDDIGRIEKEIVNLSALKHGNIIELLKVIHSTNYINIVTKFQAGMTLKSLIANNKISYSIIKHIMFQLFNALDFMHSQGVAHRDVKSENILVDQDNNYFVTLIDFGFSVVYKSEMPLINNEWVGTMSYLAPEILRKVPYNPMISDVFSCGCVMLELLIQKRGIFAEMASGNKTSDVKDSQKDMINVVLRETLKEVADVDAIQMTHKLLAIEPNERITIKEALASSFFVIPTVLDNNYKIDF